MALIKKPVTGMKDILPAEMEIRDYCIRHQEDVRGVWIPVHRDALCGEYRESYEQAGRRQ